MKKELTWEYLVSVLDYDPDTGIFTNKISRGSRAVKGLISGSPNALGYLTIQLHGKAYYAHRLAWFYCFKEWPEYGIDHIDRDRSNNRLDNLRDVEQSLNVRNMSLSRRNTSGYMGVSKNHKRWKAQIKHNGIIVHLGTEDTPELAYSLYEKYKKEHNL